MTQAGTGSPHCPLGHTEGHLRATRRAGTNMGVSTATRGQPSRLSNSQSSQSICEGAGGASGACARGPPPPTLHPYSPRQLCATPSHRPQEPVLGNPHLASPQSKAPLCHSETLALGACARDPHLAPPQSEAPLRHSETPRGHLERAQSTRWGRLPTPPHSPGPLCPPGRQTCLQTPGRSQPVSSAWRALTDTRGRQLTGTGAQVKH